MTGFVSRNEYDVDSGEYGEWTSTREYAEVSVAATEDINLSWGPAVKSALTLAVYVDAETGLMTNDPKRFEAWLSRNRLS